MNITVYLVLTHQVTAVHKANIMKVGDGLFLKCCQEVAELYPEVFDDCDRLMLFDPCLKIEIM